jgi:glycosyltransferase involved in cell wall biosynthesis
MQVSVVIPTYKRGWALQYSLSSLVEQNIPADEVVIVLRPSEDGSERIINEFRDKLPIKLVIQKKGFIAEAMEMGIRNAYGDIILFMDDDAIAEKEWVAKYLTLFEKLNDAGGITGLIYQTSIKEVKEVKQINNFNHATYLQTKKSFQN